MRVTKVQDGGRCRLGFRKTVAISLPYDRSSPDLVGMLRLQFRKHLWCQKCRMIEIQDGGCRHLGFRKTFAISLLFDQTSPNLVKRLQLRFRTHPWRRKCELPKFKMAVAAVFDFEKLLLCLYHLTYHHHCNFFTIWPIITKFGGNVATSISNTSAMSKMQLARLKNGCLVFFRNFLDVF
jgi:hypothetical protein